jgi:multidrug resistance efflux pump
MPEPVQATGDASELETLRKVNAELVAKHARDKAKLAELETGTSALQAQLSEASESLKQATVAGPLKAMCAELSSVPELFEEQFSKHYKIEMVKGALTLLTTDGKPVLGKDGKRHCRSSVKHWLNF